MAENGVEYRLEESSPSMGSVQDADSRDLNGLCSVLAELDD